VAIRAIIWLSAAARHIYVAPTGFGKPDRPLAEKRQYPRFNLPNPEDPMLLRWLALVALILPVPALADDGLTLPSGQHVTLIEVLNNVPGNDGLAVRYRFLAPQIARKGGTVDGDTAGSDMEWICNNYALKSLPTNGPQPVEIIISMSDMDVPFGEDHPEATQFFNSYAITNGSCEWEMY
jgi:hypothetical protein